MLRVSGESMIEEGIHDGDFVIVLRRELASPGEMVVALVHDEATLKHFFPEGERVRLQPANPLHEAHLRSGERGASPGRGRRADAQVLNLELPGDGLTRNWRVTSCSLRWLEASISAPARKAVLYQLIEPSLPAALLAGLPSHAAALPASIPIFRLIGWFPPRRR